MPELSADFKPDRLINRFREATGQTHRKVPDRLFILQDAIETIQKEIDAELVKPQPDKVMIRQMQAKKIERLRELEDLRRKVFQ